MAVRFYCRGLLLPVPAHERRDEKRHLGQREAEIARGLVVGEAECPRKRGEHGGDRDRGPGVGDSVKYEG